jgi:parallel beta-helix repeat protein
MGRMNKIILCVFLMVMSLSLCAGDVQRVYVDVDFNGMSDGSKRKPFKSLDEASSYVKGQNSSVEVIVLPGDYYLPRKGVTLEGGGVDKTVSYVSSKPNGARLIGGYALKNDMFAPVKDEDALKRLPDGVAPKILAYDLKEFELIMPAYPNSYSGTPPAPWLYFDGNPMTLARWPNAGNGKKSWATFTKATDTGMPDPKSDNLALRKRHPGSFIFEDDRPIRWNIDDGVWLFGYWTHDWSDGVLKISSYNKFNKEIKLAGIHNYGIATGTWGNKERRFFAQNLLEELDSPGEWYVDRNSEMLYFYPPSEVKNQKIYLATLTEPMLKIENAGNIVVDGFDIGYGHNKAVYVNNSENVIVKNCKLGNLGDSGVYINGYSNIVSSCEIYNIGRAGIYLKGGSRKELKKANNEAVNNHIHDYALFQKTYAPGVSVDGCGQIVRNNLIHDAPHNAVLYGGNEHLFELNEIHDVVLETGDSGAFYTGRDWGSQGTVLRYNYIHDLGLGNTNHANTMGIYLDDCDSGETLEGNVLVNVGRGFMIGGGRDNIMINNIVLNCIIGMSIDARGETRIVKKGQPGHNSWQLLRKIEEMNYKESPWCDAYPSLAKIVDDSPALPLHNVITNNTFINCSKETVSTSVKREVFNQLIVTNNVSNSKINPYGDVKGFSKVEDNSLSVEELANQKGIPFDKIGLIK